MALFIKLVNEFQDAAANGEPRAAVRLIIERARAVQRNETLAIAAATLLLSQRNPTPPAAPRGRACYMIHFAGSSKRLAKDR